MYQWLSPELRIDSLNIICFGNDVQATHILNYFVIVTLMNNVCVVIAPIFGIRTSSF
jgi:hypothetical protein